MAVYHVKQDRGKETVELVTITVEGTAITWEGDVGTIKGLQALMRSRGLDPFKAGDIEQLLPIVSGSIVWMTKD